MLMSGKHIRFTKREVAEARKVGLDLSAVSSEETFGATVVHLVESLASDQPHLLEKLAKEIAKVTGQKLPSKLTLIK